MSVTAVVSPEVAEEMAAILGEDEVREVSYEETDDITRQIQMSLPYTLAPKDTVACAGPCC